MARIVLENLTKDFGPVRAVNGLNLEIGDREFVVLLGASGSGKSTTLNLIAGLEEPTAGDIYLDGERITDYPPNERDMAMVFQNYALYPQMTVFDNLVFSLKLGKVPMAERQERAHQIAEMLGIQMLLERKPAQLSGGQQQRVALGRAIIRNPKVFLLDEPLSNLDAKLRLKMRSELKRLHIELGVTTIYVTHDQTEAMTMADKIALLRDAKLIAYDTPKNLYNQPPNLYTADFLGSPPINLIAGEFESTIEGVAFITQAHRFVFGAQFAQRLAASSYRERRAIIGIRPEDVFIQPSGERAAFHVYLIEFVGADAYVHLRLGGGSTIIGRVDADCEFKIDDPVTVTFKEDKIHIFNPETEERVV
ncbi:MAG: ABC transporter ATP-binding protein [Firmicutes bacterium]|nr:ABC transporter ATP-binding protein [Bacillota bacterium]